MNNLIRLNPKIYGRLRCPNCKSKLSSTDTKLLCSNTSCTSEFPIIDGIPILINEMNSVFKIADFTEKRPTYFGVKNRSIYKTLEQIIPSINLNIKGKINYPRMTRLLLSDTSNPIVLVVGGSILGEGMESLAESSEIDLVECDVSFGPRTRLICDAHDIPFDNAIFDGVIAQAVLEHVVDPQRCCAEIHRVLKPRGIVYAETPFIQQVHGGRYDFTRFTHLGHRRLFRGFDELESGAACGTGMALSWSYRYFLTSFARSARTKSLLRLFARLTSFYLKYFDYLTIDRPGTLDAASGYYFMGRKVNSVLPDKDLVNLYRGTG